MREIKFRAWLTKERQWADSCEVYSDGSYSAELGIVSGYTDNEVAISQYTGLKDKNGKEIYEGDIVIKKSFNKPTNDIMSDTKPKIVKWQWHTCGFNLRSPVNTGNKHSYEIIGNIYENPSFRGE